MTDLFHSEHAVDFERRFGGVRRLYGTAAFEHFQQAHVCVIGIGGVGAWTAEALARSAVGSLTLIDPDHLAESNITRHIHAINPLCRVTGIEEFLTAENVAELLAAPFDYVVDAIDSARAKTALIAH